MASLSLKHIYKVYDNGFKAVNDFSMDIKDKEFIVFVGPSGCGKSTTLRMIAGLEEITAGELRIGDVVVNHYAPKDRDIAMVFQSYALYPHMTVYDNIAYSLRISKVPKEEIDKRVQEAAISLNILEYLDRKPKQLSGGQRQRVALGRAIVRNPKVFLLDEPLSNLDAKLRASMRSEITKLHQNLATTFIYVTHDQVEAMTMGTRIVVMKDGYVQQIATPKEMFDKPENLFVAGFIGTPPMNFANGVIDDNVEYFEHISGIKLKLTQHQQEILGNYAGKPVIMASRAEYIFIDDASLAKNPNSTFELKVDYTEFLGAYNLVYGTIGEENVIAKVYSRDEIKADTLKACFDMEKIHFFDVETTKRIR